MELPQIISTRMDVFYNPHMRVNRDISLLVMLELGQDITVCDILGASGVRLIRALLELPNVKRAIYNDVDPKAVERFLKNVKLSSADHSRIEVHSEDAVLLARKLKNVNYLDLDPFGSPVPFLESCLFPVSRHGVLSVTATDTSVLSGTYPSTCMRRYGSKPLLKCEFYHEVGIRILIKKVVEKGAEHDYVFRPVFSYSYRHHMKVFFVKDIGARRANELLKSIGYLQYCDRCLYREGVSLEGIRHTCPYCSNTLLLAGPLWLGELWSAELVQSMWENRKAIELSHETIKLLKAILQESGLKTLGFYTISSVGKAFRIANVPPLKVFLELFEGTRTHFKDEGFRAKLSHEEFLERVERLKR